jgi:hypothetical protein
MWRSARGMDGALRDTQVHAVIRTGDLATPDRLGHAALGLSIRWSGVLHASWSAE